MAPPPPSDTAFSVSNQRHHKPDDDHENFYYANGFAEIQVCRSLSRNDNVQREKQISIDPISFRESPKVTGFLELPASLLPGKPKFLSCSLPNSANSSPRFSTSLLKKKVKNEGQGQGQSQGQTSPLQNEAEKQMNLPLEYYLRRSKSCAEGRSFSPSDDLDLWLQKPDVSDQYGNKKHRNSFPRGDNRTSNKAGHHNNNKNSYNQHNSNSSNSMDLSSGGGFKCGACLFIPGFGKGRQVRASRKEEVDQMENNISNVISRTVSLEKFECGSWASSVIGGGGGGEGDSTNHYFDLPMELIQSGNNDANSPVSSAFVFDKDIKGVLKNGSVRSSTTAPTTTTTAARKSNDSARHVRFSTASPQSFPASPTCITPRLRKAREDFNAFLEAQSA
ncbi:hypothetical protein CsatB_002207 [Cannabis sativa]